MENMLASFKDEMRAMGLEDFMEIRFFFCESISPS
jgi:hypothetical protein